ncbi:hypothetical protein, partial [Psychromonas antarctica]|uniref:hypothetical protein n=1 Tax=Psychromonas antarctica TaxID=67573 RepID=UPI001EE8CAF3
MKSGMGWLYGVVIAQLLFVYPVYLNFSEKSDNPLRALKGKLNNVYCKKILVFIIPITITLFLQWGQNSSYRIIIGDKYSVEILASIAVGFSVSGAIFNAVSSLAVQYFNPIYLRKITNSTKKCRVQAWNELADVMLPIYMCLMIFVICLSPYLLDILVAEKFKHVYLFVALGAVIEYFRVSSNVVYMVSQSEVRTTSTILPYMVGFIASILPLYFTDLTGNLWLIGVVLSFSYSLIFTLLYLNMKKILPVRINVNPTFKSLLLSTPFILIPLMRLPASWFIS